MSARRPRISRTVKDAVLRRTEGRCWYCGVMLNVVGQQTNHFDHVQPISKGGANDPSNLVAACRTCNGEKADMTLAEFRVYSGGDLFWFERNEGGWQ